LSAGDSRQPFEREAGQPRAGIRLHTRRVVRVEQADEQRPTLHAWQLLRRGTPHLQHDVGAERFAGIGDARAGSLKIRVGNARQGASTCLDDELMLAAGGELLDRLGRRRDARLARAGLAWNADDHCDGSPTSTLFFGGYLATKADLSKRD